MKLDTNKIKTVFQNKNITYAALFGSAAKGGASEKSDVDILFDYDQDQKFSLFDQIGIQKELETLIGRDVDFVPVNGLKPSIKEEVLNSAVTIYDKRQA